MHTILYVYIFISYLFAQDTLYGAINLFKNHPFYGVVFCSICIFVCSCCSLCKSIPMLLQAMSTYYTQDNFVSCSMLLLYLKLLLENIYKLFGLFHSFLFRVRIVNVY